jgi:myo-inositol-1(or 4)-monophosphatase
MDPSDLTRLAEIGQRIARDAGVNLAGNRGTLGAAVSASAHDIKVEGDFQTETRIAEALVKETGLSVFGEEAGWHGVGGDTKPDRHWVIDPLDGSMNFNRDIPICGVSLAIVDAHSPLFGIVYDFNRDELFMGGRSLDLTLNGVAARSSTVADPPGAMLATGLPAAFTRGEEAFTAFGRFLAPWKKVRMLGSASVMLAYAAVGRVDVYIEHNGRFWDVAGGLALMLAGGGEARVSSTDLDAPLTTMAGPVGFPWPDAAYMGADPTTFRSLAW